MHGGVIISPSNGRADFDGERRRIKGIILNANGIGISRSAWISCGVSAATGQGQNSAERENPNYFFHKIILDS